MKLGVRRPVLLLWAAASLLLAFLPVGAGGLPRAVNAVVFMTLGPAVALMVLLTLPARSRSRRGAALPPALAGVISLATSLTVLVLSSELLLLTGLWSAWGVAAMVAVATVTLTLVPTFLPDEGGSR